MKLSLRIVSIPMFALVLGATMPARAQAVLSYKGDDRQKVLEEGARKEGLVVLYSAAIVNQALRPRAILAMAPAMERASSSALWVWPVNGTPTAGPMSQE